MGQRYFLWAGDSNSGPEKTISGPEIIISGPEIVNIFVHSGPYGPP